MRKLLTFVSLLLLTIAVAFLVVPSRAEETLEDVTSQLNNQQKQLADLEKRQQQLSQDISSASLSLSQVSSQLTAAEKELSAIEKDLDAKENELAGWEADRDALVRELYKQNRVSSIEIIFSADDLEGSAHQFQYYNESLKSLSERIAQLAGQVAVFKSNRAAAKKLRDELATLRSQYQAGLASSQSQLSSTSSQLSSVKSSIKNLSAKQEQLILAKFASSGGSETVGDNPPTSESIPNPVFSGRPAFMIGAYGYPHRIGMSQWGAYGRAKSGKLYKEILAAYYKVSTSSIKTYRSGGTIRVKGCSSGPPPWVYGGWSKSTCQSKGYKWYDTGPISMESYIKGLGEMPSDWGRTGGKEALKAQAVAGRSYAWAYANGNGGTICPSTNCQVYLGYNKGSFWEDAVDETPSKVIMYNGAPLKAFYHSTTGGYTISAKGQPWVSGWTYNSDWFKDANSSGTFYEQIANAPWYHTGWGSRYKKTDPQYPSHKYQPWLTEEEFADIFNALLLSKKTDTQNECKVDDNTYPYENTGSYTPCLSPIDQGGWGMSTVRSKLANPITSISSALIGFTSNKVNTQYVYVYGSAGTSQFSAKDFVAMFNLRSRGTLQIPTYRFDIATCSISGCTNPTFK
jgi:peptidoglycan hydrolase-like amidase